jgi:hypothetical protein
LPAPPQRLAEEAEDRAALEERVREQLDEAGEDMAQEAVAGWEAKYSRLKGRYRVRVARMPGGGTQPGQDGAVWILNGPQRPARSNFCPVG